MNIFYPPIPMISILYVDDESYLLDIAKLYLEKTGQFSVETCTSPLNAREILASSTYDAIVSDYQMPNMDGIEFLKYIRQHHGHVPFILFTGKGREDVVIQAFDNGADFYLQKGGDPKAQFAELMHKINEAVQKRQTEQALRASEEKFSTAFSINPIAMAICEFPSGRFIDVNQVFLDYSDFRRNEVIGRSAMELGLFGDPSFEEWMIATVKKGEKIRNVEMECVRKNGERLNKLFSGDVFETGGKSFFLSYALDITDRKRNEKELRSRDAILQAIAISAGRLLGAGNLDRIISETLGALGEAVGVDRVYIYTPSGTPDRPLAKLAYEWVKLGVEPWIDIPRHNLIPYREMGYGDNEKRLRNGEIVIYSGGISLAGMGGETPAKEFCNTAIVPILVRNAPWGVIGFETAAKKEWLPGVLDALKTSSALIGSAIERDAVENALTESEELYRSLFHASPDGIVIADIEGKIRFASPKTVELLKAGNETTVHGTAVLDWIAPKYRESTRSHIGKLIGTGEPCTSSYRIMRKDGSLFFADISCSLLHDAQGNPSGIISILRDVSSRIESEEALRLANTKLTLLSSVTRHDIRNRVLALRSALDLIDMDHLDQETRKLIGIAEKAAEAINGQIEFTKEYEHLGIKEPRWQNVNELFRHATLQFLMFDMSIDMPTDEYEIFADPLIEKVFYNLLDNALRHGGDVTRIVLSWEETDAGLKIFVQDNGRGVSDEDKRLIFKKDFGRNTGLGLFLSREILSITAISIEETGTFGNGARFEITVPKGAYRFVVRH